MGGEIFCGGQGDRNSGHRLDRSQRSWVWNGGTFALRRASGVFILQCSSKNKFIIDFQWRNRGVIKLKLFLYLVLKSYK